MNNHCPACGHPFTEGHKTEHLGVVRYHNAGCIALWLERHNRRRESVAVKFDRRAV